MIGFILNTRFKVDLTYVRIPGVLQRFALVYGLVASIEVLCTRPKQYVSFGSAEAAQTTGLRKYFGDIINFPLQWLIMIILQTIWILIVYLVPFENCPAGYLGPGKYNETYRNLENSFFLQEVCTKMVHILTVQVELRVILIE